MNQEWIVKRRLPREASQSNEHHAASPLPASEDRMGGGITDEQATQRSAETTWTRSRNATPMVSCKMPMEKSGQQQYDFASAS
jgi:hypothetical protein